MRIIIESLAALFLLWLAFDKVFGVMISAADQADDQADALRNEP